MFNRVMKEKGKVIAIYLTIMIIAIFLFLVALFWLAIPEENRNWDTSVNKMKCLRIALIISVVMTLCGFVIIYDSKKQQIIVSDRIKAFAKKYKVGDRFWALRRNLTYDPNNPSTIFNDVFHFKVEGINLKRMYFELTDEFRPKWYPRRTGMSDFIIFESKAEIGVWLKSVQRAHSKRLEELNSVVEEIISD